MIDRALVVLLIVGIPISSWIVQYQTREIDRLERELANRPLWAAEVCELGECFLVEEVTERTANLN